MQLIPNWRKVIFGSWSSRLAILATVLGAVELALPALQDVIPRGPFAIATAVVTALIPVVRIIQQQALHDDVGQKANG